MRRIHSALAVPTLAGMLLLAGCASGQPGVPEGTAASGGQNEEAVAAAQSRITELAGEPAPIELAPLSGKVEEGLTYGFITCPLPVCRALTDASVEAAEAIGWTTRQVETETNPESYAAAWDTLLQDPPDVIAYIPFAPDDVVRDQLERAQELGIPVVSVAPAGDRPDKNGPVFASYNGAPEFEQSGSIMGDLIVADGGTGADTVFVWDPSLAAIFAPIKEGFDGALGAVGGEASVLEVSNQGIGTTVPGQVASFLQANPNVKYVALALADLGAGVPEALAVAGLTDIKITSRAPQDQNLQNIDAGLEWSTVAEENESNGWRVIDGLARLSLGETPDDTWFEPAGSARVFTADNLPADLVVPPTSGMPESFLTAWGIE
jgi:ABC-type sugar transport system substrate-binding protein